MRAFAPGTVTTLAAFEALLSEADHDDRLFELLDGEVVEKVPTEQHGFIAALIATYLNNFVLPRKLGRVTVEARHQLAPPQQDPARPRSLLPDVAFTRAERLLPLVQQGGVPQMPDLAVEIQSPGQSDRMMSDKAAMYLADGGQMVWLVYPDRQIVEVLTPTARQLLTATGTIDGGDVLPGFTLAVQDVFAG